MELDRILELLAKEIGNAASTSELKELEQLLGQYPDHQQLVSILKSVREKKLKQPDLNEDIVVREGWKKLQFKLDELTVGLDNEPELIIPQKVIRRRRALRWAPAFIALIMFAATIFFLKVRPSRSGPVASLQQTVPHGKPEKSKLPDGSIVWINGGSKIRYVTAENTREVYLEGEAYFQVKHDADHPFIVHAGNIAVRALGTEFNVSAYPEENVEATLVTGKVQITMEEKPDQQIILVPKEKFTVIARQSSTIDNSKARQISYEVKPATALPSLSGPEEIAWTDDKLAFQNESFEGLAKRMERRYNVHIIFGNETLKKETLSGIFENESIEKALKILQMTTQFQFRFKTDTIYLNRS